MMNCCTMASCSAVSPAPTAGDGDPTGTVTGLGEGVGAADENAACE